MTANKIADNSADRAYFATVPRIVHALADNSYQVMAWLAVKDVAGENGECYLSTEDLALLSKMSVGKFSQCRKALLEKGLLEGELRRDPGYPQPVWHLRVPDLWAKNVQYVEAYPTLKSRIDRALFDKSLHVVKPSPDEGGPLPREEGPSPGEAKKIEKKIHKEDHLPPVVHDLEEIAFYMEGTGQKKDDLNAQCPHCGAGHAQDINVCPDCNAPVVWLNSRVWKKEYGDPKDYLRRLKGEDLKPVTDFQVEVCFAFNKRARFANVTQKRDTLRLEKKYPSGWLYRMLKWAKDKGVPFRAFESAVENPDNLSSWNDEQDAPPPEQELSGLDALAMQMVGKDL